MAYSDNFPATRPVFMADFANGGKIDPRATFTRSDTPPTYAAPSAVHYWSNEKHLSSENLLTYSENFGLWEESGLFSRTGGQTDPAGGSTGFTVRENSAAGFHRLYQNAVATGDLAFTVFSKQNSGTRYLSLTLFNAENDWVAATFDLAGSAPATNSGSSSSFSGLTATQTASGNGYYKCVIKATGSIIDIRASLNNATSAPTGTYGLPGYTGDGSSSIDVSFSSLSTTGATDYSFTNGQIARSYAPTLKSVATAGQPRFEYDPAADGQSVAKGILIEGQSTNLLTYSSDMSNAAWTKGYVSASAEAVGPDGQLSAFAIRELSGLQTHNITQVITTGSGSVAMSVYAKLMGNARRLIIREDAATGSAAVFDLTTGTVVTATGGVTGSVESVSNGWYRCTMVSTPGAGARLFALHLASSTATTIEQYTGDGYSGLLLAMPQAEDQSFSSSYIATTSSAVTRAAESLSVATADIGYTGGPVSIVAEGEGGRGDYPRLFSMGGLSSYLTFFRYSSAASASTAYKFWVYDSGTQQADLNEEASVTRVAVSIDTNSVKSCGNGGTVQSDTAAVMPVLSTTLQIGDQPTGGKQWNGHIKRVALYGEALTDTNLQALTS